jgi:hypothetical protein
VSSLLGWTASTHGLLQAFLCESLPVPLNYALYQDDDDKDGDIDVRVGGVAVTLNFKM